MELKIAEPITLKCGLTLPNRLAKAAMAEVFADKQNLPGSKATTLYREWAKGQWGLVMTGNVQVDPRYLGQPKDVSPNESVPREKTLAIWKKWAEACSENGTKAIVQINHPGRQSPLGSGTRGFFEKTLAPSAVPMHLGDSLIARALTSLLFGTPKEMSVEEIQDVVRRFAFTAKLSADAGFAGCEIHAAHGYLLAQFLSPKTNRRTDAYGGSPKARAKIVVDIIHAMREAVPAGFCIGIKLNSVDHQNSADLSECIEQLHAIADAGIDFLEISGGSYENPTMFLGTTNKEMKATEAREAFFLEFANAIRAEFKDVTLMVTGGFRTRKGMEAAVSEGYCDLVGLGRPAVIAPQLPKEIVFNPDVIDLKAVLKAPHIDAPSFLGFLGIKVVGAGVETSWYSKQIGFIGSGKGKPKTE